MGPEDVSITPKKLWDMTLNSHAPILTCLDKQQSEFQ
jgi:hypothetical protein